MYVLQYGQNRQIQLVIIIGSIHQYTQPMIYEKYKIPPDFDLAQRHGKSCKLFSHNDTEADNSKNKCGCCNQYVGQQSVSMCQYVSSLRRIGEEVPLFFNFTTLMILLIIAMLFVKAADLMFFCGDDCDTVVKYHVNNLFGLNFAILMGYIHKNNNLVNLVQLIVYSVLILSIKIYLKTKKYKYRSFNLSIEKRSLQLINLPKDCTQKQIRSLFKDFNIEDIVFTYRVREYHNCMRKIAVLKKSLRFLNSRIMHGEEEGNGDERIRRIEAKLEKKKQELNSIVKNLGSKKKRLSVAFVVFQTINQRNKALKKFKCGLPLKIVYKLCTCCSKTAIRKQHVTVQSASAPDDIKWQNLQNPYLRTKAIRFSSFLICITILCFGIVSQVFIFNFQSNGQSTSSTQQLFSSFVIFLINFFIINFLEYTTKKTQCHISNTNIKLSLIRKITFFMFVNVSISPFLIMIYNRIQSDQKQENVDYFQNICLTILIVSIGNMFKPLLSLLSIERFSKFYKRYREKSKGAKSQLNQLQANQIFQPLQFPIEIYYSLLHASLMMTFFYLGCFQILIIIQLPALLFVYFVAKWMLLKICKQPRGISLKLNNLAQSLMRFYLFLFWTGRNIIPYITNQSQFSNPKKIITQAVYGDSFQIASTSIVVFMLLCQPLVSIIAMKMTPKKKSQLSQYYQLIDHNRTYRQANLFFKIHEQGFGRVCIKVEKKRKQAQIQQSEQSIQLRNDRLY